MENFDKNKVLWKSKTVIYNFNDKADFAYFLTKREIQIKSRDGTCDGFINKDEVFGEHSIALETTRTVTAKASKDSSAIKIPKDKLMNEYNNSSLLIKAILRSTYMRLTNLNSTLREDLNSIREE